VGSGGARVFGDLLLLVSCDLDLLLAHLARRALEDGLIGSKLRLRRGVMMTSAVMMTA